MQLFLDSANLEEIGIAAGLGLLDGVTTNPKLLASQELSVPDLVTEICALTDGPVCIPVRGPDDSAIVEEGRGIAELHDNVIVKIPIHEAGLRAMAQLHSEGIRTHATLCCSAAQALVAAKCGAYYVSPFVARLEAIGLPAAEVVEQILEIYDNYEFDTRVLVASVKSGLHVQEAAVLGVDACTMSLPVMQLLARHPLSDKLHDEYLAAWPRSAN